MVHADPGWGGVGRVAKRKMGGGKKKGEANCQTPSHNNPPTERSSTCGPCVCSHSMKLLGEKHRGTGARTHREHTERPRVRSPLRLATCCCWPPAANESAQASHGVGARHGPGVSSQGLHAHQLQTHSCELRVCACGRLRRWGVKHAGTTVACPTNSRCVIDGWIGPFGVPWYGPTSSRP